MNLKEKKILLVEDDPPTAVLEKRLLERNGFQITLAYSGEEALELCNPDFDLVLMDIDLGPGIKGTEAAERIIEKMDVPLAFLSSHTDRETVDLTEGITSYGYILKNSGPVVLIASIRMVFRIHEARMQEREQRHKLAESESRYRELFEENPLPMWVYDMESLAFLAVNDAAIHHYGYSRDEFLSMTIADIRPQRDVPALRVRVRELIESHSAYSSSGLWQHQKKNGETIDVEITGHSQQFQGRDARLILARDVTDLIAAQEEVHRQLAEKEQLLKEFYVRTRSHISALEEMLRIRAQDMLSEEARMAMLETLNRVSGLRLLYDRLLSGSQGDVSAVHYLEDLAHAIFKAYTRLTTIRLETSIENVELSSNQLLGVGTVLNELMMHSLRISFLRRTAGKVFLTLKGDGHDIMLTVADDGESWSLDQWETSQDSFGLSVILMVAEQLGGCIGLEPDHGNTVNFRFPRMEPGREIKASLSSSPLSERFRKVIEAVDPA